MTVALDSVAAYYGARLAEHGATARGVDWNDAAGQHLRFAQLCRVLDPAGPVSVNDLGCGYGALADFLAERPDAVDYRGFDVSAAMVAAARSQIGQTAGFAVGARPDRMADYGIASGIFNVRLATGDDEWLEHVCATLDDLAATSRRGFAFNCLTSNADADRMRPDLYYADPAATFDWCARRYSRHVALLHDYALYEFTMIVRLDA